MNLFVETTQSIEDNAAFILSKYLRMLKAKVTSATLREALENHPDYPSVWAMSDVLNDFKVENGAFQLDQNQFAELETPFIAHLNISGGWFAFVTAKNDKTITWFDSKKGFQYQKIEEFLAKWSGIVLAAEPDENSGERNYQENYRKSVFNKLRFPLISILAIALIFVGIFNSQITHSWQILAYTICKILGAVVGIMLIIKQFGGENSTINKLCHLNEKSDCNSIINSPAAKIFAWLSWSEVGLIYFVGGLLTLLFAPPQGVGGFLF